MDVLTKVKDKATRSAHQHAIYLSGYEPLWHEAAAEVERLRAYVGTLDATERRLRALLRRARQALRSFDELSDEELGNLLTALNAAVE